MALPEKIRKKEEKLQLLKEEERTQRENELYKEINPILAEWQKKLLKIPKEQSHTLKYRLRIFSAFEAHDENLDVMRYVGWNTPWTYQNYVTCDRRACPMEFFSDVIDDLQPPEETQDLLATFGIQYEIFNTSAVDHGVTIAQELVKNLQEYTSYENEEIRIDDFDVYELYEYHRIVHQEGRIKDEKMKKELTDIWQEQRKIFLEKRKNKRKREQLKENCIKKIKELYFSFNL